MTGWAAGILAGAFWLGALQQNAQQQEEEKQKKAAEEAIEKFKAAYGAAGASEDARTKAVKDLAVVQHRRTAMVLIGILAGNELIGVRITAADALATYTGLDGIPAALIAIFKDPPNAKKPDVRKACIRALGELKAREAVPVLHEIARKKPYDVAREAVVALGKIRMKDSIPPLIDLLRDLERSAELSEANPLSGIPGLPGDLGGTLPGTPGTLPGLGGIGGLGGYIGEDDLRREQEERRRLLVEPTVKTLLSITREKWTTSKEWEIWWRRYGATFVVPK